MSRLMGFIHDEVEKAGHQVDYLGCEDLSSWLSGKLSRFAFSWVVWRHAVAANQRGEPYDIVTVHEPSGACINWGQKAAGSPKIVAMAVGLGFSAGGKPTCLCFPRRWKHSGSFWLKRFHSGCRSSAARRARRKRFSTMAGLDYCWIKFRRRPLPRR